LPLALVTPSSGGTGQRSARCRAKRCCFCARDAVCRCLSLSSPVAAQAQMRGSLHAHVLVWFQRRVLASGFTHLEPIHRAAKATTESRQRPRAHEVPPQPGQIKPREHYQEDNVSHAPCITYGQARAWCGDGRAARPRHMSTSTPRWAVFKPRWSGLPSKAPLEARPSVDSLTRSYG
jgi:hypothetical protein